jgi:hypothetical protein
MEQALADLRAKYERTPESSPRTRQELERMIKTLEAEIELREARRR